jgi:hypothetical protein
MGEEVKYLKSVVPDQATEAIADFALQWQLILFSSFVLFLLSHFSPRYCMVNDLHNRKKPFAVIPCCVYH